jgi:hypothetical protein
MNLWKSGDLEKMSKFDLQLLCKDKNIILSGEKEDLIKRILSTREYKKVAVDNLKCFSLMSENFLTNPCFQKGEYIMVERINNEWYKTFIFKNINDDLYKKVGIFILVEKGIFEDTEGLNIIEDIFIEDKSEKVSHHEDWFGKNFIVRHDEKFKEYWMETNELRIKYEEFLGSVISKNTFGVWMKAICGESSKVKSGEKTLTKWKCVSRDLDLSQDVKPIIDTLQNLSINEPTPILTKVQKAKSNPKVQIEKIKIEEKSPTKQVEKVEIKAEEKLPIKEVKKTPSKKKSIPKHVKTLCWNKYIGENVNSYPCTCCNVTTIKITDFHCGHVKSESDGGETRIDNLRPICSNCNLSMGTMHMEEYQKYFKESTDKQ